MTFEEKPYPSLRAIVDSAATLRDLITPVRSGRLGSVPKTKKNLKTNLSQKSPENAAVVLRTTANNGQCKVEN